MTLALLPVTSVYAEKFTQNGTEYVLNPELRAQFFVRGEKSDQMKQFSSANVFLKTDHFVILKQPKKTSALYSAQQENGQGTMTYPVVYDTRTEKYGILRGHFIVKMKEGQTFSTKAKFHVAKEYPEFSSYVIDIPKDQTIQKSLDQLTQLPGVDRVSVEISEAFREPV